jgi:hypothetical protein
MVLYMLDRRIPDSLKESQVLTTSAFKSSGKSRKRPICSITSSTSSNDLALATNKVYSTPLMLWPSTLRSTSPMNGIGWSAIALWALDATLGLVNW